MMRPWTLPHILFLLGLCAGLLLLAYFFGRPVLDKQAPSLTPVSFAEIENWRSENHAEAFETFLRSCRKIVAIEDVREKEGEAQTPHPLLEVCFAALGLGAVDSDKAREFFEAQFIPHRYGGGADGFVTGYYEPELKGARTRSETYAVPVYGVPDDLVPLFPDEERARRNAEMTAGRKSGDEIVPYYDRREIEEGALDGRGLEILWLADPVDAFYMHIQGSGRVALEEGGSLRLSYAAKNGHSYTAIGAVLIERGEIAREEMSMDAVRGWLADHPDEARELMWQNRSYIFFRELPNDPQAPGPEGAQGVPLTPLRSLAVDTSIHDAGTPVWVDAPDLALGAKAGFHRLMVAQDTGSAIRGPQRGDIYWGSGDEAGAIAGRTRHTARFTILLPKAGHAGG